MSTYVRGSTIHITVAFTDLAGSPAAVDTNSLTIDYPKASGGGRAKANLALSLANNIYSVDWDSSVSGAGDVYYSATGKQGTAPTLRSDGSFTLTANKANAVP